MELTDDQVPVYLAARLNTIAEVVDYIRHNCLIPAPADALEERINAVVLSVADEIARKGGTTPQQTG